MVEFSDGKAVVFGFTIERALGKDIKPNDVMINDGAVDVLDGMEQDGEDGSEEVAVTVVFTSAPPSLQDVTLYRISGLRPLKTVGEVQEDGVLAKGTLFVYADQQEQYEDIMSRPVDERSDGIRVGLVVADTLDVTEPFLVIN